MFGPLRDLPEFMTGGLLAAVGWYALSFGVLAPRAMSDDAGARLVPACVSQLAAEQDQAIARATERKEQDRAYEVSELRRTIRLREQDLQKARRIRDQFDMVRRQFDETGIGIFMPPPPPDLPNIADFDAIQADIQRAKDSLSNLPPISLPRLPDSELMNTCACASLAALAGRRADYAVSLASFRLITPERVASAKDDVSRTLRFSACGSKPWENLT